MAVWGKRGNREPGNKTVSIFKYDISDSVPQPLILSSPPLTEWTENKIENRQGKNIREHQLVYVWHERNNVVWGHGCGEVKRAMTPNPKWLKIH